MSIEKRKRRVRRRHPRPVHRRVSSWTMVLRLPVGLLLLLGVCSGARLLVATVSAFVPSSSSASGSSSATVIAERIKFQQLHQRVATATATTAKATAATTATDPDEPCFDIDTALFCAGLAFDAYVEPPPDSSRWERGVRFISSLCFPVLFCFTYCQAWFPA